MEGGGSRLMPAPLNQHSFYYYDGPSMWIMRLMAFTSFCMAVVCYWVHYGLLQLTCIPLRRLHSTLSPRLTWTVTLTLTAVAVAVGLAVHVIITILFCAIQLAYHYSQTSDTSAKRFQEAVLFIVMLTVADCVPNAIVFYSALPWEMPADDGWLLFEFSTVLVSLLACHFRPHARSWLW